METSQTVKEIATALAKFQGEVGAVVKDSTNPYFKSKYATLDNFIATIKNPLSDNGLSFVQMPSGENQLCTMILHKSGEWLKSTAQMYPSKNDPQGQGSAITYMRRYALSSALGIATEEDDDANAASTHQKREPMKSYRMDRTVPREDDEAGGAVMDEAKEEQKEWQKERMKDLLVSFGHESLTKAQARKIIKEITDLDVTKDDWGTIIKRLENKLDEVDPLASIEK